VKRDKRQGVAIKVTDGGKVTGGRIGLVIKFTGQKCGQGLNE
jgi:hypothetical protein